MSMFTIKVPASSANIGPGFDSAGIALNRYLTLHIEPSNQWEFEHQSVHLPPVQDVNDHLIYQTALQTAKSYNTTLSPCKVIVESDIPLARGLGSSASAIIAGIELANQLCQMSLSNEEKLKLATNIEGHPDNVTASLYGGIIFSVLLEDNQIEVIQKIDHSLDFVVYIPPFELKTTEARKVLPDQFSRSEAAAASAVGNVMISALLTGNYELAGKLMEKDLFHEPYRAALIPHYTEIRQEAKMAGAYGTVISGAGPTLISVVPKGQGREIAKKIQTFFPTYDIDVLSLDSSGVQVK